MGDPSPNSTANQQNSGGANIPTMAAQPEKTAIEAVLEVMGGFRPDKWEQISQPTTETQFPALFTPLKIGSHTLAHRLVLPPLTRHRSSAQGVPNVELYSTYYSQRATKGGLLIAEATNISQQATGYFRTPGIYTDEQTAAWKQVTRAAKAKGAVFYLQLWHVGRVSHSKYQPDGRPPVGASPIPSVGLTAVPDGSKVPYEVPRELRAEDEIPAIVEDYRRATKNAFLAGFDGVEIHAANGYLIDQFLKNGSNQRTDKYGGSIENRSRFLFEVLTAVQETWKEAVGPSSPQANNVGIRLSPFGIFNSMSDTEEADLYRHVILKLNTHNLAFLDILEPRAVPNGSNWPSDVKFVLTLGKLFSGVVIAGGGYNPETANNVIQQGAQADPPQQIAVAIGRPFIANPDLPLRVFLRAMANPYDRATFYTHEATGYIDQPFLEEQEVQSHVEALTENLRGDANGQTGIATYITRLTKSSS